MRQQHWTKRKRIKKKSPQTVYQREKKKTDDWCSRYVRIKAVVDLSEKIGTYTTDRLGECFTCGKIKDVKYMDSGHFKSRGSGGSSGLYFDLRAIRCQCKVCNGMEQGKPTEYREALIAEQVLAGLSEAQAEKFILDLEIVHKVKTYSLRDIIGLGLYFKQQVEEMLAEHRILKWW